MDDIQSTKDEKLIHPSKSDSELESNNTLLTYVNKPHSISLDSLIDEYNKSVKDINSKWKDLAYLDISHNNIVNKYFKNIKGKFNICDNILYVDIEDWGIEKFYIHKYNIKTKKNIYNLIVDKFKDIYNVAISIQIANWHVFLKIEEYLVNFKNINTNIYFVIINELVTEDNVNYISEKYENFTIIKAENRGMDIGLFLVNLYYIKFKKYSHDYLFKIHTKTNDNFRNETLYSLLGTPEIIIENIKKLSSTKNGMVSGNLIYRYNEYRDAFTRNMYYLEILVNELYGEINCDKLEFSAGTMFIAKSTIFNIMSLNIIESIYNRLNNSNTLDYYWYSVFYNLDINDKKKIYKDYLDNNRYPNNLAYCIGTGTLGLRDCMIEHSIERLLGYICKECNLNITR
jgi:hypothetical protein